MLRSRAVRDHLINIVTSCTYPMRKLKHREIPRPSPATVQSLERHPIVVVLSDIRSVYNVGSIFRTSDAALVEQLYLTGITATPEHRGIHKTALGAQDTVPWQAEKDSQDLLHRLRARGYTIAVLEITDTPSATHEVCPDHFPLCLILGNEVTGVADGLVDMADLAFEIPQYGAKQSLNVAVAYGVAIFDLVRKYRSFAGAFNNA